MSPHTPPSIDLHGLSPEAALRRLEQGLHTARAMGSTEVIVIAGRGIGNRTGRAVLREKVLAWLQSPAGRRLGVRSSTPMAKGGALRVQLGPSK
jgi:DNA-nicking Smr family endonuclease